MSGWDLFTWGVVLILGPGAVLVFVAVLRDLRRLWCHLGGRALRADPPQRGHRRATSARSAGGKA
jgi:hypothetical protein